MAPTQAASWPLPSEFRVVKHPRRKGYAIQAPAWVKWAGGPGNTFAWYKSKSDAEAAADAHNRSADAPGVRRHGHGGPLGLGLLPSARRALRRHGHGSSSPALLARSKWGWTLYDTRPGAGGGWVRAGIIASSKNPQDLRDLAASLGADVI